MIKRILDSRLPAIIYNPPKVFEYNWFTSIYQAGALPVFDTEFFSNSEILEIIKELNSEKILFGLRIFTTNREILDFLDNNNIINLDLVVLSYTDPGEIPGKGLSNSFYKLFIEVRHLELERTLERISPHGLILKGSEAPGRVAHCTSFILMQWYLENSDFPLFIHGGVGMHTTAGLFAAGVCGIVLDNQLYLTDEAPLAPNFRKLIAETGEKDTLILGEDPQHRCRVFGRPGTKIVSTIKENAGNYPETGGDLYSDIESNFTPVNSEDADPLQSLFYLGQDALFASHFTGASAKLADVLAALFRQTGEWLDAVDAYDPLVAASPLACIHGTEYPVIQVLPANTGDPAGLAKQVFDGGALPFFTPGSLPLVPEDGSRQLPHCGANLACVETSPEKNAGFPAWVKKTRVKFALLPGAAPGQAKELDACGVRTYLSATSVSLLENALCGNITGFIFEGADAGGDTGNLTSLVLWETVINKILCCDPGRQKEFTILFAGGISTEYAAFFISGMCAYLAKSGIRIGISADTPNLFTQEMKSSRDVFFRDKALLFSHLNSLEVFSGEKKQVNDEIAVIGMGCLFPDASDCAEFWHNIVTKKYSITELPVDRFNHEIYCNSDRKADDKGYSRIAGMLKNYQFDYKKYGYTKEEGDSLSRSQQIILDAAFQAVAAAGYDGGKRLPAERTTVIIASCSSNEMYNNLNFKYFYPEIKYYLDQSPAFHELSDTQKAALLMEIKAGLTGNLKSRIPVDSLINVEASRVARHLGITGSHYCIDAACASSLAVIDCAVKSLLAGEYDYAVAGGLNTNFAPETMVGFSKIHALSDTGSYPFDERANGFVIGEGAGVLILKRMKDAVRDKDPVCGIIKSIGGSSDGKGKAVAAPQSKGQELAVRRCYEKIKTGVTWNDIQFIEAHGTATKVGDVTEVEGLARVFMGSNPVGISSVKSQIGHLLGGAGVAGMIKTLLAIKNRTLPPNGQFGQLSSAIQLKPPLYIIKDSRAWETPPGVSRKAGISSYGFGGINYHICVEEYTNEYKTPGRCIFPDPAYDFNDQRIVVAGMGCVLPGANTLEAFWSSLVAAKPQLSAVPAERFHNAAYAVEADPEFRLPVMKAGIITDYIFDHKKYRFPPVRLINIERTQLYALDAASQAVEQANLLQHLGDGNKTAVIIGNSMAGEKTIDNIMRVRLDYILKIIDATAAAGPGQRARIASEFSEQVKERYPRNNENTVPGLLPNIISSRIANFFNCNSVNFTIDAASASAAVAASVAIKGLLSGEYDFVISGGSHSNFSPAFLAGLDLAGLLSRGENRIFDKKADGVNPGEGAAVYILTTYGNARKHNMQCYAEIQDFTFASGIKPQRLIIPEPEQYIAAIKNFYKKSALVPRQVNYLEICGLANISSDATEYKAINKQFTHSLYYGNIKPVTGYLFAANPAVVILKLILMNYHRTILPNWYCTGTTSMITNKSVLRTNDRLLTFNDHSPFNLAMNFYGFGGNHVHGVIHSLPPWLTAGSGIKEDVLRTGAFLTGNSAENRVFAGRKTGKIAVLLSGQGAQEAGMMKDLYNFDETIHFVMDEGDKIFKQIRGYSLLDIIFNNEQLLNLTINTQPAIFLISAAIFNSLRNKELKPDYFIGHSLGEFTALYCAGILDFKEALNLVIKRSDIMHHTAISKPGSMVAIFNNAEQTRKLIQKSKLHYIYIANTNSEQQTVVSGENYKIEQFIEFLKQENESYKKINASAAFHTPLFKSASRELAEYLETIQFNYVDYSTVFSNVTGMQYPSNEKQIKKLLEKQMISTVEFVESVKNASRLGVEYFIEIGPKQVLSKLVDNIDVSYIINLPVVYQMYGEVKSFKKLLKTLEDLDIIQFHKTARERVGFDIIDKSYFNELHLDENDFSQFIAESREQVNNVLYREYLNYKKRKDEKEFEKLGIYTGDIVISGAAVGLPGSKHSVFNRNNFDEIITGTNYIEALSFAEKRKILDKNITGYKKDAEGETRFQEIKTVDEVIQFSGHLGYFDLKKEYGIQSDYDITCSLAIAAGFEVLKDANIPLVMQYKQTAAGAFVEEDPALPPEMQERTGVIFTSLFPGFESVIDEVSRYYKDKFTNKSLTALENFYSFLLENITDEELIRKIKEWYGRAADQTAGKSGYKFKSDLLFNIMSLGSAHFAGIIKAKGPNMQLNSSYASTIQAIGVAEDWIRANRADRVIIIGSDAPTSGVLNEWIGSCFLAVNTAADNDDTTEAAVSPERNGMILGSGAVALIIEKKEEVVKRGMNGQAQILGTYTGNSACLAGRIDAENLACEMKRFLNNLEKRYNLKRDIYARALLFMSHEAYSQHHSGAAADGINALKSVFPKDFQNITVTSIKGYTGNTLGASIEDAVLVKSLQKQRAPAIANSKENPGSFKDIKFSTGRMNHYEYGLHMAAGLGSQFAFLFLKRIEENLVQGNELYKKWLSSISNLEAPELKIEKHILRVESRPVLQQNPFEIAQQPGAANIPIIHNIKEIISRQTGYSIDMLEENLDFEADLGIDTVKQVQIFGKVSSDFGFEVPEDLKLNKLNTITKLVHFVEQKTPKQPGGQTAGTMESNGDGLKQEIKKVITAQTGYTGDMLEDNLDFEADLGIDTVKQVQIFGKLSDNFGFEVPDDIKLSRMNTITKLEEYVKQKIESGNNHKTGQNACKAPAGAEKQAEHPAFPADFKRYTIKLQETELPAGQINIFKDRTFLVSADNYGFAGELVKNIAQKEGRVLTIGPDASCDFRPDFSGAADLEDQVMSITNNLPEIHGFIHLLPLNFCFREEDLSGEAARAAVQFYFLMLKALYGRLCTSGKLFSILSFNSIVFPYGAGPQRIYPLFAGLAGMMKTLKKELPGALVKAVDFCVENPLNAINDIVRLYLLELMSGDTRVETGYRDGKKYILSFCPENVIPGTSTVKDGDTILVVGGARGITFEIIKALTEKYKIRLIILGRSEIAGSNQKYGIDLNSELCGNEQKIMAFLKDKMKKAKPLEIKRAAARIGAAHNVLNNIQFLKAKGIETEYYSIDVQDYQALRNIITGFKTIDGILFAAGIEESELIGKKTLASFNNVFNTKVSGILNLLKALETVKYRYLFAFSSVAAKLGNAAQVDYAAANDMLGKIIQREKTGHPDCIYKVFDWTAWEGIGLAARESVREVLKEMGVKLLPPKTGIEYFINELYEQNTLEIMILQ